MNYLDTVTNAVTAFQTWEELQTACQGGYVPTLYGRNRRERILRRLLAAYGFGVWPKFVS